MYRLGIWVIALALVVNGVAGYAWADAPRAPAAVAYDHHDAASRQGHANGAAAVAADAGQTHGRVHHHLRCCGVRCNVVPLVPGVVAIPVTLSFAAVVYPTAQPRLVGHLVALDPEIPKSAV